jgi:hypothetical protein
MHQMGPVVCVPKKTLLVSLLLICRNTQIKYQAREIFKEEKKLK